MAAKQRVLLVARNLRVGGVERNTVNLANTLVDMGHEAHIIIFKNQRELLPDERVKVHLFDIDTINRLTLIGLLYDLFTRALLATTLRGSGFVWRGVYGGLIFRYLLKRLERRYGRFDRIIMRGQASFEHIWSFHDPRAFRVIVSPVKPSKGGALQRWYARLLYGNQRMVANSADVLDTLKRRLESEGVAAASLSLIHNPCPIARIQQMAEEPAPVPQEPYLVHVARLVPQKNQELLLRAYKAAAVEEKLYILGSGKEEKNLKKLAQSLGIADKVVFTGQQINPYPWMKHAKMFILSSRVEGFGLVLVESLACGTQVVSVDCPGGIRLILIEEQKRLIAEPTAEALAAKIREALVDPVTVKPEWYWRFDAKAVAQQFLDLN